MDNDMKTLIESFRGYRDLLTPVQNSLHDFVETYEAMQSDIEKLNEAFKGDIQGNLEKIYKNLSKQAESATDLSSRINQFITMTDKYTEGVNKLAATIAKVEERLKVVNEMEQRAEEQIGRLDEILEEKKKGYNLRELQRTLESYNANVQKVSEYINKDIAEALSQNYKKLDIIKSGNDNLVKRINEENTTVEALLATHKSSNEMLKQIAEKGDVNQEYIYEILDKWANERKVKIKK
jgi:chemotaxis regulatin CheY-phosphate phosphatase CheZ